MNVTQFIYKSAQNIQNEELKNKWNNFFGKVNAAIKDKGYFKGKDPLVELGVFNEKLLGQINGLIEKGAKSVKLEPINISNFNEKIDSYEEKVPTNKYTKEGIEVINANKDSLTIIEQTGVNPENLMKKEFLKPILNFYEHEFELERKKKEKARERENYNSNDGMNSHLEKTSKFIDEIFEQAILAGASDAHFEPKLFIDRNGESNYIIRIRFRIDGKLINIDEFSFLESFIPYKILAENIYARCKNPGFKLTEKMDGKMQFFSKSLDKTIDVRVSGMPTNGSIGIVTRFLGNGSIIPLEDMGMTKLNYDTIQLALKKKEGMLIVTGPTGSGKTTTLYSALSKISKKDNKVISLEDPVEAVRYDVTQCPIIKPSESSKGFGFEDGLEGCLRHDPDVILIGEMRGKTEIGLGITAALTGHYLLSTNHTNDALSAIPRMIITGANKGLLVDALIGILAQRLLQKQCKGCSKQTLLTEKEKKITLKLLEGIDEGHLVLEKPEGIFKDKIDLSLIDQVKVHRKGDGCKECLGIGHKGRVAVHEFVLMSQGLRDKINEEKTTMTDWKKYAQKNNKLLFLYQDALLKMLKGKTTYEAVDETFNLDLLYQEMKIDG